MQTESAVPAFVEGELQAFLACGDPAAGFTRLSCPRCGHARVLPFSCKTRTLCPSCAGRRMNETAAFLVEHVVPDVPVRHWALTFRPPPRYLLAYDSELCSRVTARRHASVGRRPQGQGAAAALHPAPADRGETPDARE